MKNKKQLIFLLIILLAFLCYGVKKIYVNPLRKQHEVSKIRYENMLENFKIENYVEDERNKLCSKLEELNFNSELCQEKIIRALYECSEENQISISNIKFQEDIYTDVIEIVESEEERESFYFTSVNVEIKLEFHELLNFIDTITDYGKYISVTDLRIMAWEGDVLYGVLNLKFYAAN